MCFGPLPSLLPAAAACGGVGGVADVVLGAVGMAVVAIETGTTGLQAQAPARHPGRVEHGSELVLLLKL